MSRGVM